MCQKCKKKSCTDGSGCGGATAALGAEVANLENTVAELTETLNKVTESVSFLLNGHPIVLVEHVDDVAQFDMGTGKGSGDWESWAVCDGQSHLSTKKKNIITPNFTDRFIVQAGGTYAVDDIGGAATVVLTTANMPAHTHSITDPGHTHGITDPGHDHPVTDPGHSHGGTGGSHTHTFTTSTNGDHSHLIPELTAQFDNPGGATPDSTGGANPITYGNSNTAGAHTHTGTTDAAAAGITISDAFTGIDVTNAFTGITADPANTGITGTGSEGSDTAHENLPPYYAAIYVMRIG